MGTPPTSEVPPVSQLCSFFSVERFLLLLFLFILWGREKGRERERAGERGRRRGRETLKQPPCSARSLMRGSIPQPWDHDLNRNRESDTQPTEPPWRPGLNR